MYLPYANSRNCFKNAKKVFQCMICFGFFFQVFSYTVIRLFWNYFSTYMRTV